jgi:hypothetical protein
MHHLSKSQYTPKVIVVYSDIFDFFVGIFNMPPYAGTRPDSVNIWTRGDGFFLQRHSRSDRGGFSTVFVAEKRVVRRKAATIVAACRLRREKFPLLENSRTCIAQAREET